MRLNVYLTFPGTCEEAMTLYAEALGGEVTRLVRHGDTPAADHVDPDWHDKLMHAHLCVGDFDLMASDTPPQHFVTPQGYHVSVQLDNVKKAERIFAALSAGAEITMPLEKTFWAKRFGMLTDRFGINWMVNCA